MKKVSILYSPGTNCEEETAMAFKLAGAQPELLFLADVVSGKKKITDCDIFCFPGGFSFGDHIETGVIVATLLRDHLPRLMEEKIPIIGICNGFQQMVRAGMFGSGLALVKNDSGFFCSQPTEHKVIRSACIWTDGLEGRILSFPSAHKFGKLVHQGAVGQERSAYITLVYPNRSPNGGGIAGICSENGLLFGLMDHPERPYGNPDGLEIFRRAVNH